MHFLALDEKLHHPERVLCVQNMLVALVYTNYSAFGSIEICFSTPLD